MLVWPEIIKGIEFAGDDVFVATGEWREGGREGGREGLPRMLVWLEVVERFELAGDNVFVATEGGRGRGGGRGGELLVEGVKAGGDFSVFRLSEDAVERSKKMTRNVEKGLGL